MKIFLDDLRIPPDNTWTTARTAQEAIFLLDNSSIEIISLDHDLGIIEKFGREASGIDVINHIEKKVIENKNYIPPQILCHTQNPVGRENILRARNKILKLVVDRCS